MHIVTIENFLFCFRLETGGYFLGWFGLFFSLSALFMFVVLSVLATFFFEALGEVIITTDELDAEENVELAKMLLESQICK